MRLPFKQHGLSAMALCTHLVAAVALCTHNRPSTTTPVRTAAFLVPAPPAPEPWCSPPSFCSVLREMLCMLCLAFAGYWSAVVLAALLQCVSCVVFVGHVLDVCVGKVSHKLWHCSAIVTPLSLVTPVSLQ